MKSKAFNFIILATAISLASCHSTKHATATTATPTVNKAEAEDGGPSLNMYKRLEFDRYFFDGIKEKTNGNFQRAAQNFDEASHVDANNPASFYELGNAYLHLSKIAEAEIASQKAVKLDGHNKWYISQLADIYRYEKKWALAADMCQKLIEESPEEMDGYFSLAEMQLAQNKTQDAIKTYDKIDKKFGKSQETGLRKYKVYMDADKPEKALDELERLITENPKESKFYALQAETYMKMGKQEKAIEVYNKLLAKNPDNGEAQMALAEFYYKNGDRPSSINMLKKAFANKGLSIDAKIGILYNNYLMPDKISADSKKEAYALTEILVQTHPEEAKAHAIYADFLYQDKKLKEALAEYRRSRDLKDNIFAVWQQIFFIESELRDNKGLEEESNKALELFPSQPMVYFFNGRAKIDLKDYKGAIDVLESGLGQNIDNPKLESEFYINLAEAYYRQKNYKESDLYFEKVLKQDPTNATAMNNYAYYLSVRNEKLDRAEDMSKRSLELEPNNSSYQDTYGWILYQRGKYAEAAEYIKKSLDAEPGSAEVNEHYGDAQYKLGNVDNALQYWKKAKSLGSDSPTLDKKISDKKINE